MSMIKRFKDIMASNFYALLEKAEDPEKMLDQYMRELQHDLGRVKAETASVMAEEQRTKRALDDCLAEMNKLERYAKRALDLSNETDARLFLERKAQVAVREVALSKLYELAAANAIKMREMHDKLHSEIRELEARKGEIKARFSAAKMKEKMNRFNSSLDGSAFSQIEEKANRALYEAEAMAELNSPKDELDELMAAYNQSEESHASTSIDAELEALKKNLKKK